MQHINPTYITINKNKLKYNIQHSFDLCKEKSINLAVVSKSICADEEIISVINDSPTTTIADSRIENFMRMKTDKQRLLIRPATPSEADVVVTYSDISFVTEEADVIALNKAAAQLNTTHDVLLMVDIGDLRDGVFYKDKDSISKLASLIHDCSNIRLAGIATNYNCFLGYLPTRENMLAFEELYGIILPYCDVDTPIVSGGNSSAVSLITASASDVLCASVNQFRMGEAIMLGRDPADNTFISGYNYDVFTLHVPLIEVQTKPMEDGSDMRRGILAIGKQDLQIEHIIPRDERLKLLGGCSDECVIDLSNAPEYKVGDSLEFDLEYGALMTAFTNTYVTKKYI